MSRFFTITLRAGVAAAILVGLFGQVLVIPNSGMEEFGRDLPHGTALLYSALCIIGVACIQVVMGAVWMLLGMIERDAIFSPKAFRWIDAIIAASVAATLVAFGATVHLMFFTNMPNMTFFGMWLGTVGCFAAGACFTMLMVVMRGLLRKATDLETEMAEVV